VSGTSAESRDRRGDSDPMSAAAQRQGREGRGTAMDRRSFLGVLPGTAIAVGGLAETRAWRSDGRSNPYVTSGLVREELRHGRGSRAPSAIGLQLYTVRSVMTSDPDGTLAAIAAIGYEEVELAGLYGMSAREMKARLDTVGLAATSSHHSVEEVRGSWEATLEAAVALGQRLVVVPALPAAERAGEALRRVADDFNRAGEAARAAGLRFGYHNHDWEMRPGADGVRPIDLLLDRTDPELVDWQMDIFWVVHGGADPMAELDARARRVTSVHVKDRTAAGEMADVGAGVIDFRPVLARAGELGLLHQYVEHDQPGDPIESVRASYRALRDIVPSGAEDRSA